MTDSARKLRADLIACARRGDLAAVLDDLPSPALEGLLGDWLVWARDEQLPPEGAWTVWLLLGGRGSGKTRAGAEWVRGLALGLAPFAARPVERIALVGETLLDARDVMVEGVSGLLSIHGKAERPDWQPSRRRLAWPNGAVAQIFSAQDPESLRGPQFGAAWCDELGKWPHPDAAWDMLQFGLRLGDRPRQVVTTTPRPTKLLKALVASPRTAVTRMSTAMNAANLAPGFLGSIVDRYAGTRLGRQELDGLIIEDRPDALWRRDELDEGRLITMPDLARIVVAVDPPATSAKTSDACGIVVGGLTPEGTGVVLADLSVAAATPQMWAARAVEAYHAWHADQLVAEVNQGGDMVSAIIAQADPSIPVAQVRATRGKWLRAEPIALLYSQRRIVHLGVFTELEDQMCNFGIDGLSAGHSPDRLDAMVWAMTALCLDRSGKPKIRRV